MGSKGFYSLSFHSATGKQGVLSWSSDNRVALACEAGVYVLVIKTSPTDFTASFVIHKECIPASQDVCTFDVGVNRESLLKSLDASALSQLMLDRSLSPSIASSVSRRGCRRPAWSPVGGDARGRCALAVLSHDHRFSIHTKRLHDSGWEELTCLSTRLHAHAVMTGFTHSRDAEKALSSRPVFARFSRKVGLEASAEFLRFQSRTYSLCTELVEWSTPIDDEDGRLLDPTWVVDKRFPREMMDIRAEDGSLITPRKKRIFAFLFSLTISGHLVVWKAYLPLSHDEDIQLLAIFHLGALQPSAVSPLQPSSLGDQSGFIAVGFHSGVVKFVRFDWSDMDNVSMQLLPIDPWEDEDNLAVSNLHWYSDAQLSCLIVLKQNYIMALRVSPVGLLLQKAHVGGITCLGLTGISKLDDSVLISSADGLLLKATFSLEEESQELRIFPERVAINCSGPDFTQCGVAASPNGIYVILAETFALSYDHLRTRDPLRVHILPAKTVSQAFDIMLESPLAEVMENHLLSGYHDCLECIRQGIASGDELPALLLQQVNARSQWKDFSDFHLKLTRFATDLLMAPTISKTSESVTQLEGSKRLLDNLILWRYVKKVLTGWIQAEEGGSEGSGGGGSSCGVVTNGETNTPNAVNAELSAGSESEPTLKLEQPRPEPSRNDELHSLQLMLEWMSTVQPFLVQAQHISQPVDEELLKRIHSRLKALDPDESVEDTRRCCVVCSRNVHFPAVVTPSSSVAAVASRNAAAPNKCSVGGENEHQTSNGDQITSSSSNNVDATSSSSITAMPNLATNSMAHVAGCVGGHQLSRCCRTFLPCASVPYRKCVVCGATSLDPLSSATAFDPLTGEEGWLLENRRIGPFLNINCVFCDGLLITT